jgi:translocator protein
MPNMSTQRQLIGLVGWLVVSFSAASIGAVASLNAASFYGQLSRPRWAPPSWLFAPVWTLLYVLMAVAAWLVWRSHGFKASRKGLVLFLVQLAANALWTWLFFAWHQGAGAFSEILILWALIVATIASFRSVSVLAATLFVPYLAWVTFAAVLTLSVWQLNPGLL